MILDFDWRLSEVASIKFDYQGSYVYLLTCQITQKKYIGRAKNLKKRLCNHLKGFQSGKLLSPHISQFGAENISIDILEAADYKDTCQREIYYIDRLKTFYKDSDFGLNANRGGKNFGDLEKPAFLGKRHSDTSTEKMRLRKLKEANPMYGKKSKSRVTDSGVESPWFGTERDSTTKDKISRSQTQYEYTLVNIATNEIVVTQSIRCWTNNYFDQTGIRLCVRNLRTTSPNRSNPQSQHKGWRILSMKQLGALKRQKLQANSEAETTRSACGG